MLHDIAMSDAVFEVSSALGTVGITGAEMPALLKSVLILDMLLGRIEIIPFFAAGESLFSDRGRPSSISVHAGGRMVQIDDVPVILALALGPGIFWVWFFYTRDRYEPEPAAQIVRLFFLGMFVTVPVAFIEGIAGALIAVPLIMAAVVAPVVEEFGKFFVVRRTIYPSAEFDEPIDGIVYAAATALGFASLENVIYITAAYLTAPALAFGTFVIRAIFSVPGHALFSGVWGYALGRAKFAPAEERQRIILRGLVLGVVLHGIFNFLLVTAEMFAFALIIFILVLIPVLWVITTRNIRQALQRSRFR